MQNSIVVLKGICEKIRACQWEVCKKENGWDGMYPTLGGRRSCDFNTPKLALFWYPAALQPYSPMVTVKAGGTAGP